MRSGLQSGRVRKSEWLLIPPKREKKRRPLREQTYNSKFGNIQKLNQNSKVFDSGLLDVGLLDLVRKPSRSISWLVDHANTATKDVDTLGATLT